MNLKQKSNANDIQFQQSISYLNSSMGNSLSANRGSLSNPACSNVFGAIVTSFPSLSENCNHDIDEMDWSNDIEHYQLW